MGEFIVNFIYDGALWLFIASIIGAIFLIVQLKEQEHPNKNKVLLWIGLILCVLIFVGTGYVRVVYLLSGGDCIKEHAKCVDDCIDFYPYPDQYNRTLRDRCAYRCQQELEICRQN